MIASTAVIYPGVTLGSNIVIEDFCIIGASFRSSSGELTFIGDGAIIRSHTVIYAGNRIGRNFQSGNKANIRELNTIGDDVSIGALSVVEHHVKIGDGVRIHSQVFVPEYTILEKNAWLGPGTVITNSRYPRSPSSKTELEGVRVEENAKIGAAVTILPGVLVGKNTLVGAGSVVTKNLESDGIYAGNPAVFLRRVFY